MLGVAAPYRKIQEDRENVYKYTAKGDLVAIITDGTAVLGLGDIGFEAALAKFKILIINF